MLKHYFFSLLFSFLVFNAITAQKIKIFNISDFDLSGNVKKCTVIKDYGQEIFEFDKVGRLVKSTTQYNESDKDITIYKYDADELIEKRMESYKENQLDRATSMVNFYEIDTTRNKYIKERIISFDKEFFEQQEYYFDSIGKLEKVISSHENAVDEVLVERANYKDEVTETVLENGIIKKSVRSSIKRLKSGKNVKVQLIKEYIDGEPNKAVEEITSNEGRLLSTQTFLYNLKQEEFEPIEKEMYSYDQEGVLTKKKIQKGNAEFVKEFIFQFDNSDYKNWVKKIITPDNSYTTRRIEYYAEQDSEEEKPN